MSKYVIPDTETFMRKLSNEIGSSVMRERIIKNKTGEKKMKFKVGDKVRVVNRGIFRPEIEVGTIGVITNDGDLFVDIDFQYNDDVLNQRTFLSFNNIELVEEPKIEKEDLYPELNKLLNKAFRFKELNEKLKELLDADDDLERYLTSSQTTYNEHILYGNDFDLVILTLQTMDGGIYVVDYVLLG